MATPQQPLNLPSPTELVGRVDVPDPARLVTLMQQGFANGFITTEDIAARMSKRAALKKQLEEKALQQGINEQNELGDLSIQAKKAQLQGAINLAPKEQEVGGLSLDEKAAELKYGDGIKYYRMLAPAANLPMTMTNPDGTTDYAGMAEKGAQLLAWQTQRSVAQDKLTVAKTATGKNEKGQEVLFEFNKYGEHLTPEYKAQLTTRMTKPFATIQPGTTVAAATAGPAVQAPSTDTPAPVPTSFSDPWESLKAKLPQNLSPDQVELYHQEFLKGGESGNILRAAETESFFAPSTPQPAVTAKAAPVQPVVVAKGAITSASMGQNIPGQGMVIGEQQKPELAKIPAEAMAKLHQVRLATENVADVTQAYHDLKAKSPNLIGVIKGRVAGPLLGEWDVYYKRLENAVNATVPGMARGVFGEVGVLSDNDVKNYKKLLPTAKIDPAVAEVILSDLTRKTDRALDIMLDSFGRAGYDASGFKDLQAKLNAAQGTLTASTAIALPQGAVTVDVGGQQLVKLPNGTWVRQKP